MTTTKSVSEKAGKAWCNEAGLKLKGQISEDDFHAIYEYATTEMQAKLDEKDREIEVLRDLHLKGRLNVEDTKQGVRICFGLHAKNEDCEWREFVRTSELDEALNVIRHYAKDHSTQSLTSNGRMCGLGCSTALAREYLARNQSENK